MTIEELLGAKLVSVRFLYGNLDEMIFRTPGGILYAVYLTADYDRSIHVESIVEVME